MNQHEDEEEIKPLHFAVQNNCLPAVEMLLLAGADPSAKTASSYTSLDIAKLNRNEKIMAFLGNFVMY